MRDELLNRAIAALNDAGFEVVGFRKKECEIPVFSDYDDENVMLKLWVVPNGDPPKEQAPIPEVITNGTIDHA